MCGTATPRAICGHWLCNFTLFCSNATAQGLPCGRYFEDPNDPPSGSQIVDMQYCCSDFCCGAALRDVQDRCNRLRNEYRLSLQAVQGNTNHPRLRWQQQHLATVEGKLAAAQQKHGGWRAWRPWFGPRQVGRNTR